MTPSLTVIILVLNEEKHLARCLQSLNRVAQRIVVVDSYSTDATLSIARSHHVEVFQHAWINYATQLNWALDNIRFDTDWTMRLDADEVVTPQLEEMLIRELPRLSDAVNGLSVNRQIHFLGRWIRHGAIYPAHMLRVWRTGCGRCEDRWMDEHMIVEGAVLHFDADIADINLNNLTWWTDKHNRYASREAVDLLMTRAGSRTESNANTRLNAQAANRRRLKETVYARLPLGLRALLYFVYRYFVRLGFLDGWQGLAFHFLQGFWYRFLVDMKVRELQVLMRTRGLTLSQAVRQEFGYEI